MSTRSEIEDLALCLETTEAAACKAKLEARKGSIDKASPIEIARVGRTILFSARRSRRKSAYNRAIAFSNADREHLDGILQWLRERDAYFFDVASALVDDRVVQALVDDGLHLSTVSNVVVRVPEEMYDPPAPGVEVQEISLENPGQLEDYGVALHRGFKVPKVLAAAGLRTTRAEFSAPGWHIYLAYLDGKPAALANLYIAGGVSTNSE